MASDIFENYINVRKRAIEQADEVNKRFRLKSLDARDVMRMYMSTIFPGLADRATPKVFVLYSKQAKRYLIDTVYDEPKQGTIDRNKLNSEFVSGVTGEQYLPGEVLLLEFNH